MAFEPPPYDAFFTQESLDYVTNNDFTDGQPGFYNNLNLFDNDGKIPKVWEETGTAGAPPTIPFTPETTIVSDDIFTQMGHETWLNTIWQFDGLLGAGFDATALSLLYTLDLGFIVTGVTKNVLLFNTYPDPKNITAVDLGILTGITTDLVVPYLLGVGAQKLVAITFTDQGEVSLEGTITFITTDADDPNIDITGTRAIVFPYEPDWSDEPTIEFIVKSEVFQTARRIEQRSTTLLEGEYDIEMGVSYGVLTPNELKRLYNRFVDIRSRPAVVPFYPERLTASVDVATLTTITITNFPFSSLKFEGALIIRLDNRNLDFYEVRNVVSINVGLNQVVTSSAWSASIPAANQSFFFLIPCSLSRLERKNATGTAHVLEAQWAGLPI